MQNLPRLPLLSLCAALTLVGCGSVQQKAELSHTENQNATITALAQSEDAVLHAKTRRINAENVNAPYIAGTSIPLAREAAVSPQLRKELRITASFANTPVDLATALLQISNSSGVIITATPDALLPASSFALKSASSGGSGSTAVATIVPNAAAGTNNTSKVMVRAVDAPIWSVLDDIAAQTACAWRTTATGVEFYRVVTTTYDLMTIAATAESEAAIKKTADKTGSSSSTSFKASASSQLEGIKSVVDSLLTTGGKFSLSPESQTLVVTDTPAAQERIAAFIKKQNKAMSRRVRVLVEAIDVTINEDTNVGVDWNLIYNSTKFALSQVSPTSTASPIAGGMNFGLMDGKFSGSGIVLNALANLGKVSNYRSFPLLTTNGRPVTTTLSTTFSYVDQVQTMQQSSGAINTTTTAPTVSQKQETVGTFLTIVPTAKPDGTIFLSSSMDTSTADPLQPFTVGSGSAAVTVQLLTKHGNGSVQEVPLRAGQTEVIGGMEIRSSNTNQRTMGEEISFVAGGSKTASHSKTVTVLLVTAVAED